MHMKDDHMRNVQLKPGYNIQIGVDSEYIVATDIFQDRNDVWTFIPFLQRMEKHLGFRYPSVSADSGYESEEAYDYLESRDQKHTSNPRPMRNGRSVVLRRTSADGKTWSMIRKRIPIPVMPVKTDFPLHQETEKQKWL